MGFEMDGDDERKAVLQDWRRETSLERGAQWLERMSLDAVVVAVLWGVAQGLAGGASISFGILLILALATWLTYVADRLRDAAAGRNVPTTCRHLYYRNHYKEFRIAWLVAFPVTIVLALVLLPLWKFIWGWVLVGLIIGYLYSVGKTVDASRRLLLKRLAVPLIFTAGVGWMTEGWRTAEGGVGLLVLFMAALCNVLLISSQEKREKTLPSWLPGLLGVTLVALVLAGNLSLLIHWPTGVAALYCAMVYFILLLRIKERGLKVIRLWVDAALADGAILVILLQYWY
jgi:hypothetical protein